MVGGVWGALAIIGLALILEHLVRQAWYHARLQRQLRHYRALKQVQEIHRLTRALRMANAQAERFERLFYLQCQARESNPIFQTRLTRYLQEVVSGWGEPRHARNLGVVLGWELTTGDLYDFVDAVAAEERDVREADRQDA